MNFTTRDYNDELEGDFLACRPGNEAEGLEVVCTIGMPVVAAASLANALWLLYLAHIHHRHRKLLASYARGTAGNIPKVRSSQQKAHHPSDVKERFSYVEKLLLTAFVASAGVSVVLFINGAGTMYPTTHIYGRISDAVGPITLAAVSYLSLLQHRGAIYFKSLIPEPEVTNRFYLSLIPTILDLMQSWLAPVIGLVLWTLLHTGVFTRGWFCFWMFSLHGIYGLRSFVSIVNQRLTTLRRVVGMVNANASGTREDRNRRRSFLAKKLITLVIDLVFVFIVSLLFPASVVFLGSTFNSRLYALNTVIAYIPVQIVASLANYQLHSNFNKSRKKSMVPSSKKSLTKKGRGKVTPTVGDSSVMQSELVTYS